jgi:hypothetical protein
MKKKIQQCTFFWVIPRRLNFICRRFGTPFHLHSQTFSHINTSTFLKPSHPSYLPAYEDGTVFRNVGIYNSDAWGITQKKACNSLYL